MTIIFTNHAQKRIKERSDLTTDHLSVEIKNSKMVSLGSDNESLESLLYFSPTDCRYYVLIYDFKNKVVITFLTIEFWHNTIIKRFKKQKILNIDTLRLAAKISDPENPFAKIITKDNSVKFNFITDFEKPFKSIHTKIKVELFISECCESLQKIILNELLIKLKKSYNLENNNLYYQKINYISWGLDSKNLQIFEIKSNNFSKLIKQIKKYLKPKYNTIFNHIDVLEVEKQNRIRNPQTYPTKYFKIEDLNSFSPLGQTPNDFNKQLEKINSIRENNLEKKTYLNNKMPKCVEEDKLIIKKYKSKFTLEELCNFFQRNPSFIIKKLKSSKVL